MSNNGIGLTIVNPATQGAVIYVNTEATLTFTLTNQTGAPIPLTPASAGPASELDVYMPLPPPPFFTDAELQAMSISLADWNFAYNATTQGLTLVYAGPERSWADGATLQFDVTGVESTAQPTSQTVQVSYVNLGGNAPPFTTATLTLNNPPSGSNKLTDVLQVSLDNQGTVFVSGAGDALQNMLTLNVKNVGPGPLYTGSAPPSVTPRVIVTFVYGSTSGALAPDVDHTPPLPVGSAWNILASVLYSEGNDWVVQNPQPTSGLAHPQWVLQPANTNVGVIGTGAAGNITFSFAPVVSFTPPGHTQMTVQFTGFMKDANTPYDDAVWVLDISKQNPPPTRGLINFFSPTAIYSVTQPTQAVSIPLRWAMFDVARVTLLNSFSGSSARNIAYPNPAPVAYDSGAVTIPGTTQNAAITCTLQAYDGNGGYLNSMQFTAFIQADMFVDNRDGRVYPAVQIGTQRWMAANLDWAAGPGSALYGNAPSVEAQYGRLYTQATAMTRIPQGWRLPSQADWQQLLSRFSSPQAAYAALIAGGSTGFQAQLGGQMDTGGNSTLMGSYGYYWNSTASGSGAMAAVFVGSSTNVSVGAPVPTGYLLSVRYVQDVS